MNYNLEDNASIFSNEDTSEDDMEENVKIPPSLISHLIGDIYNKRLSEDVHRILSVKSTKRLLDVIHCAKEFMLHHHRQKLSLSDFKKAIKHCMSENVFLECSYDDVTNNEVDLKNYPYENKLCEESFKVSCFGKWLSYFGNGNSDPNISQELQEYFDCTTDAILGNESTLLELVFCDLKRNCSIFPLIPYFLNLVSVGVSELNSVYMLKRLLNTVCCLITNPTLYFGHEMCLSNLCHSLLTCILRPLSKLTSQGEDHWLFRDVAANLLIKIFQRYPNETKLLYRNTVSELVEVLNNWEKPFHSHYGAIITLMTMGIPENDGFILLFVDYLNHLKEWEENIQKETEEQSKLNKEAAQTKTQFYQTHHIKQDAFMIYEKLLLACELLIRHHLKFSFQEQVHEKNFFDSFYNLEEDSTLPLILCVDFVEYFGDALSARLPLIGVRYIKKSYLNHLEEALLEEKFSNIDEIEHLYHNTCKHNGKQGLNNNNNVSSNFNFSCGKKDFKIKDVIRYPSLNIKLIVIEKENYENATFQCSPFTKSCIKAGSLNKKPKITINLNAQKIETPNSKEAVLHNSPLIEGCNKTSNINQTFKITIKKKIPHKKKDLNEICGNMLNIF